MTPYEKLKSIIQAANSEKNWTSINPQESTIRLADVLLAYQQNGMIFTDKIIWKWNLKDDNLDHQSEETKQFLIDLLIQPL